MSEPGFGEIFEINGIRTQEWIKFQYFYQNRDIHLQNLENLPKFWFRENFFVTGAYLGRFICSSFLQNAYFEA